MFIADSIRYTTTAFNRTTDEDWSYLIPENGPSISIAFGSLKQTYTLAMLHQLACLRYVQEDYTRGLAPSDSSLIRHCLNYMRQSLLCHAETRLESLRFYNGQA
jgi:hypothetical protein